MFLGIDLGTGSVKALLLSEEGGVVAESSETYSVHAPHLGWAETQPENWWSATCKAVQTVCQNESPLSISFSGQMHGTVLADKQGRPLRPAVLWADTRSSSQLQHFKELNLAQQRALANPLVSGMMGSTLLWLREHESDRYKKATWALQPKDWLRFQCVGTVATEPSDASATLLYDLFADDWAHDVINALELRSDLLAPLKASSAYAGSLTKDAARALSIKEDTPVFVGGGDAACSAFGSQLRREGQVQINIGTAMQIFAILDNPRVNEVLTTHLYRTVESNYYAMAAMQNAGIAFEWVRRIFSVSWEDMYKEAFSVNSSEGVRFLPYLTGERTPHMNSAAKGTWHGLSLKHERGHMLRAVFEGVAFALKDGLRALENTGVQVDTLRLAGGGSSETRWQSLLATILGKDLYSIEISSASAKGAALLGAKGAGYSVLEEANLKHAAQPEHSEELELAYEDFKMLYTSLYGKRRN